MLSQGLKEGCFSPEKRQSRSLLWRPHIRKVVCARAERHRNAGFMPYGCRPYTSLSMKAIDDRHVLLGVERKGLRASVQK